jgi:Rieske Fe-S protein
MSMTRREFLVLTATACAGCTAVDNSAKTAAPRGERAVNAGPVSRYAADGVYNAFRDQGFFIVRKGGQLMALSSYCTHRRCKLTAEPDRSFYCECHGSTFDPGGKVTEGPATRSLPVLPASTDAGGHLIVKVPV